MGLSSYTYVEATWTQALPDWTGAHVRAFDYFGGVTEIVVPDNLASGVSKACRYEPDINPTYQDLAAHYDTAVVPSRVRKPRDKAKAEAGVLLVERWILASLRHRTFFSLDELNAAIGELREALNDCPFQKKPGSRRSLFEKLDKPALKPLPLSPYPYGDWKKAKVNIDYHPNSAIAEFKTADSPEVTALSAKGLLTVRVSTPRSPFGLKPCLSDDLTVCPKINR